MTDNANPQELLDYDLDRIRGYRELIDFYHGRHWEGSPRFGEKRLTLNYARVFIDKITSYVMSGMSLAVEPRENTVEAKSKARRAEEALRQVYEANNLAQLDFETETDCSVLGDACFKVVWDSRAKSVRVTAPDVQGIYAWWQGDDISKVWRVASRYVLSAEEAVALYQVRPRGKTASLTEFWTDTDFELYLDNDPIEKKTNPYGFIPFIIFPNLREPKRFWGISDLPQLREVQRELNRAISQLARILELSGNPIAVLENVESAEDIAVKPGAVWNVPESARAYLLDLLQGGGVKLHIDYIELLYRALHDISESPRAAFGGMSRDLSGVALEIELQPLIQKIQRKRLIRTAVYNRRNNLILRLLQQFKNEDFGEVSLRTIWSPVLPRDVARVVASEQALVQSGIHSRRHAMDELGISDAESEFQRWLEEREAILKMNKKLEARSSRSESE
ncbi:MAG: phage portal protein [Chloroflexota bacterium]